MKKSRLTIGPRDLALLSKVDEATRKSILNFVMLAVCGMDPAPLENVLAQAVAESLLDALEEREGVCIKRSDAAKKKKDGAAESPRLRGAPEPKQEKPEEEEDESKNSDENFCSSKKNFCSNKNSDENFYSSKKNFCSDKSFDENFCSSKKNFCSNKSFDENFCLNNEKNSDADVKTRVIGADSGKEKGKEKDKEKEKIPPHPPYKEKETEKEKEKESIRTPQDTAPGARANAASPRISDFRISDFRFSDFGLSDSVVSSLDWAQLPDDPPEKTDSQEAELFMKRLDVDDVLKMFWITEEPPSAFSVNTYRKVARDVGDRKLLITALMNTAAEYHAGEIPRNKGAALVAKLRRIAEGA